MTRPRPGGDRSDHGRGDGEDVEPAGAVERGRSPAEDPGSVPHLDAMSVVEAEADAEVPDVELDLAHPLHPLHAGRPGDADIGPTRSGLPDDPSGDGLDAWSGPMPNHHVGRQRVLVLYLRVALVVAFVVGVVELVIPEQHRDAAGIAMVAVFVVAPLGRVLWLVVRWQRRGDWRFALVGLVLLAVVLTGFLVR